MRQSTRLIVNMLTSFGRMAVTVGMGLLATRLTLRILGPIDYGVLGVLGATGALLTTITASLTQSVQRELAVEVGKSDVPEMSLVFCTAVMLLAMIGGAIFVVGQAFSPLILHGLNIPAERMDAAWWVFAISLLLIFQALTLMPYQAMLAAHQDLVISALFDVASAVLRIASVICLFFLPGDKLIAFMVLTLLASLLLGGITAMVVARRYPAGRLDWRKFRWSRARRIGGFAGWTMVGTLGWQLRSQGGAVVLNLAFGPLVNTAYSIALQLVMYLNNLNAAVIRVVQPAMVAMGTRPTRHDMHRLAVVTSKYSALMGAAFSIPILIEMPLVLQRWLGAVHAHTVILAQLCLGWMLIDLFTIGHWIAMQALGDIGRYMRLMLILSAASLALAAGAHFILGWGPWALPVTGILHALAMGAGWVGWAGRQLELPASSWARHVFVPVASVAIPATAAAGAVHLAMEESLLRAVLVGIAYLVTAAPLTFLVGLSHWERQHFQGFATAIWRRVARPDGAPVPATPDTSVDQIIP